MPSLVKARTNHNGSNTGIASIETRGKRLEELLKMIVPTPDEWVDQKKVSLKDMQCADCTDYNTLVSAWKEAMQWTDGLDHALTCMLAVASSTRMVGDQLWMKIVSPPATGKSTLCEAISVCRDYVVAKSTIRGFHSGYRYDMGDGEQDHSLIRQIAGKTLVTKDGDTLLQSPNLGQILSEARDLYDSTSRSHYRNAMSKDYEGIRMTWLLCGTSSLRQIDQSELGERFLDCVIMDTIQDSMEDPVLLHVANRADRNMGIEVNGKAETNYEPELAKAMCLTGGYVQYLRRNAFLLMKDIVFPDEAKKHVIRLGKFVAHMRARPSKKQDESHEREFATRLVSQLVRLGKCLALVLNKEEVDYEVLQRIKRVALDTSRGQTMTIVSYLYDNPDGLESATLGLFLMMDYAKMKKMLQFLRHIGVAHVVQRTSATGVKKRAKWCLTDRMKKLYEDIMYISGLNEEAQVQEQGV